MARADYFAVLEAIEAQLKADEDLAEATILVEEDLSFQSGDTVIIYLERRSAPANQQGLSAGKRTRFLVEVSVWCYHFGLEARPAMKNRDDLMGRVEIALMRDRTLRGMVDSFYIDGGSFNYGRTEGGLYMAGAEVRIVADLISIVA